MRKILPFLLCCLPILSRSQTIIDSCFQSANSGISFNSSPVLANSSDADLIEWTGTTWTGDWPNAQINLSPPCDAVDDRAIWMGDESLWTTGGEGFSAKLSQPLVAGTTYSFTFTYVSHGLFSFGSFSPYFCTGLTNSYSTSYLVGQLPAVGFNWETNTYTFTATNLQNGHLWILLHSNYGSGMVLNLCSSNGTIDLGVDTILCNGDTLPLFTSAGYDTYEWNTGDTTSSISIISAGTYYVTASTSQCIASDTINIGYIPCNFPQSAFLPSDTEVCEKFCIDFTDQSTNNPTSWLWLFPGCVPDSSTNQNPSQICYQTPGTFDVTLITTNANGTDTLTLIDYITVYPTPPFPSITQNGYTLTSSPAAGYQWQFNSVDIPGATNQSYTLTQEGYYTIVITDSNGCINSATLFVQVTGVENQTSDFNFSIYPNPSNGIFSVQFQTTHHVDEVIIRVYNMLGEIIFSEVEINTGINFTNDIDLSLIPSGIYFFELSAGNSGMKEYEFLVKKKFMIVK